MRNKFGPELAARWFVNIAVLQDLEKAELLLLHHNALQHLISKKEQPSNAQRPGWAKEWLAKQEEQKE